ncbi:hypothetical protein HOY80DRAFT_955829 [Tuber brumale]|nr:hypothetical protein HOY80DRAFT_955829 [Tuber brumale]
MDSSTAFFEFVFSESSKNFQAAYESLASKPYQIFDILLKEERFTNFFSRIGVYGNNLANLLSQFPSFQGYDYRTSLLQELIRAFTLSLLAERFDDVKSRDAAARIVVSVVKLSDPTALGQLGTRLGALPGIFQTLIAEGHIKNLALSHKQCFEGLISEPQARDKWVEIITDLCKKCGVHGSRPERTSDIELAKFIRTAPCEFCTSDFTFNCGPNRDTEGESTRLRDYAFRSTMDSNVFSYLLGEPLGPWKIILSQEAMENLREANIQGNLQDVHRKFCQLASGDWGGKKIVHRANWGNSLSYRIPLFKAFYKTGYFILWQIDTAFDERFEEDYQVIKVWAIGKPQNLDKIGVQIHRAQQVYTSARAEACNRDDLDGSREIRHPARVWLEGKESGAMKIDDAGYGDFDDSVQLAKFYSLTTTVLDNITSTARNVAYPVDLSREEASVVNHFLTPAFILGRSGTGKTTCLVYKLVGRYLNSMKNGDPLRQVLLTRSKRLASKIRINTSGLIEAKLGERKRQAEGNYAKNDDFDDNTRKQFSSLTDMDFPLVCTFDYLLRLIENSIRGQESRRRYMKIDNSECARVINFAKFKIEYWEHLSSRLKRGIPVELAFLEIMGVIKGSVSPAGNYEPLSRQEYLGKRWRLAPNFASEREREAVYELYEWYERTKKKRGDIDQPDRIIKVNKALEAFSSSEIIEDKIFERDIRRILDEIYVDEVQDQRTSDIGMLLALVRFPRGIHFAGDTAQCISKDALFRFANAKSLFYERFKDSTSSDRDLRPTLRPLSHNYRSHKQILSVASLVMDLLYRGFPDLVDESPPEIGDIPGPKPTLYVGNNITNMLKLEEEREGPQKSNTDNSGFNEYGGVRVILVRDKETRDELRAVLGRSSEVLTILQSKGMEFEDVFLYNFLSTSPYSHKLDILEEVFKRGYHKDWTKENIALCSELKHLYVGVTRARHRLWILESNTGIVNPVQRLFNKTATSLEPDRYPGSILEILTEQDIEASELHRRLSRGSTMSAARWREMGHQMIDDEEYSEALHYFEEAKDLHGIALANAYITEEIGLTRRNHGLSEAANSYFKEASKLFLQAGSIPKAVQCRKEGGDPKGAVKILADNGAYEDAAWLAADFGLFSETSEIYTKLNKHEKALAGYARAERFEWMFNYIKRFKSEIDPYCRKQYVQFGYLKEFGKSDLVLNELEKRALDLVGSPEEQEMLLSRFHLMNKLFQLLTTNEKYTEAYEVGVTFGILEGSFQLLCDKILPQDPNWGKGAEMNTVCMFLQAEYLATNPRPRTTADRRIHKVLQAAVGRGSSQIDIFVKMWKDINKALDSFGRRKTSGEIGNLSDMQIASYVDILVTKSVYPDKKFQLPIDHIERVLGELRILSSHGKIPSAVQFYCGIYEMPRPPGKYIFLEWSPFNSEPGLSLRPVDISTSLRDRMLRHILRDIVPPLVSLDKGLRVWWDRRVRSRLAAPLAQAATHFENLELLARLCRIFSNASAMIKGDGQYKDSLPQNWDWRFWRRAFLEQTEFRSAYEHSLGVLSNIKSELVKRDGKYHTLHSVMIKNDTTEYRIASAIQLGVGGCVSSLLAQYQTSLFLGYKEQWRLAFLAMRDRVMNRRNLSHKYGSEMITIVNQFLSETEAGDFPGKFCENIYRILGALRSIKNSPSFYSPSVISLYEELALSLIFLVRPYELLIPESWHRLYFSRWERKYRSPSVLERLRYQQCLVNVCLSFCEMILNIEGKRAGGIALGRRSVTLIVVCLINLGTFFPRPKNYVKLWLKSQEVFCCATLNARGIQKLREDELIGRLANVFREYGENDSICVVWGHPGSVASFAGIPLKDNGVSVVNSRLIEEKKRHLWKISNDPHTRKLNTAHILTAFWERNGPKFLRKMKERRERYAAWILTAFWKQNGPKFLRKMKERRRQLNAARILVAFWRLNGPRFVEKMKERRRYLAPRYKYPRNCCLLVDMGEDKSWMC